MTAIDRADIIKMMSELAEDDPEAATMLERLQKDPEGMESTIQVTQVLSDLLSKVMEETEQGEMIAYPAPPLEDELPCRKTFKEGMSHGIMWVGYCMAALLEHLEMDPQSHEGKDFQEFMDMLGEVATLYHHGKELGGE